jgi:hypothetical protein
MRAFPDELIASAYMRYWMILQRKQYCQFKEEAVDHPLCRTRSGRGYGRVVRQTTELTN